MADDITERLLRMTPDEFQQFNKKLGEAFERYRAVMNPPRYTRNADRAYGHLREYKSNPLLIPAATP